MGGNLRYSPMEWIRSLKTFTMCKGDQMAAGTGFTGTGTICKHSVTRLDGIVKTEILIDLTGTHGGGTAGDIIGLDGGAPNCHIGRITEEVNGTIIAGILDVHETPAGGDPDVDIYAATEPSGAQDAAIGDLVETQLCNSGDLAAGTPVYLTAWPTAGQYLYLTNGTATDAAYTAGRILITLWGYHA